MRKLTLVILIALFILSVNRLSAQHPIVAVIDSCKAVIAAAPIGPALWTEYSQASVDGINYFIKQADSISAGSDEAKKANAISDLRYYMSRFAVNPGLPAANTYYEDFDGMIKYNLWNELGGLNGITQSIDNGALKFDCYSNGSMWFSPKITFGQAPQPLTMDLKEYPYVSFKAKAAPGATYDGVVVDSVNITFNDNYQPYQVFKIPADGAWHDVLFNLPNTQLASYTGYDQFWLNPGMEQGHFSSEFIGSVWIDDFKAGKATNMPAIKSELAKLIDSCKAVVAAAPIGPALWTEYSQASVDGINYFIKQADSISAGSDKAKKANAISDLMYYMSRFYVNPGLPAANTYSEDFDGIIKYNLWNELGGANGITQSIDNGALKFDCYSNGSMWFSPKITFGQAPQPLTMDLKEYPYVSFKAKAAPGATYDGVVVDSVNITFNDNYQPFQVFKIPADGAWHDVLFNLPNTQLASYTGYDQFWLNPGMEQGHFTSEFIGTVWVDDFKAGKAVDVPAAESDLATLIDSCNAIIAAVQIGPALWTEYSQASVDGINYFIKQADSISAGTDEAKKVNAISDLRYYMSRFYVNPGLPAANTYSEDFNGIIKYNLWNELGGANGITQSIDNGALKFDCYSNGSMWFSEKITFSKAPQPLTMDLKEYPYVSFKAKAAPGATYDGVVVDSVNITFNDNYEQNQVFKIPADGAWHDVLFNLPNTKLPTYTGYDQFWLNPGMEQGHFTSEFIGTVWIDDFKAGKAVDVPDAKSDLATLIDSCNAIIAAAPIGTDAGLYTQATVNGINTFIAQADIISAGSDDALKTEAVKDLRYYMSLFKPNPAIQILDSFEEDFSGIVKQEIWNTLGGANGIVPTFENGALKYTCTSNGSYWYQSQLRFWAQPLPIVMELKANPYVQFKAMAEPGATYDGYALDSVSVSFTDNYGEYQSLKIPADSTWHELTFFLAGTTSATYSGFDQWWINPGLTVTDGHFSHEFIGAVWIDDLRAGKGIVLPDATNLTALIDSSNTAVSAVVIGDLPGQYAQQTVDAANAAIATAQAATTKIVQDQVDQAETDLRAAMSLFQANVDHTAVNNYSSSELKMYPNPVSDVLTISKVNRNSTISIYSLTGQKVMKVMPGQQEDAKISLRKLQPGTYIIQMTSDKGTSIGKFIKK